MRQDPNAVPHPRASCEQISPQRDQDQQAEDRQPPVRRSPAWRPPAQQPSYQPSYQPSFQPTPYRQAPPIYPAAQHHGFPGQAPEDPGYGAYGDQETEATLASVRAAQRKARRMQAVCVFLGACAAAIFLLAAVSHQLDGHIEMTTPVLLLTSSVNFRRYAQRVAKYRAAESDLLARVR